jgi:hypothetical protein
MKANWASPRWTSRSRRAFAKKVAAANARAVASCDRRSSASCWIRLPAATSPQRDAARCAPAAGKA